MNALRMPASTSPKFLANSALLLHVVPAASAPVDEPQSCALVDLIRITRLDRVILTDDLQRIARAVVFVPAFCFLAFWYEFLGIEASA